jgi:hypothetical protein
VLCLDDNGGRKEHAGDVGDAYSRRLLQCSKHGRPSNSWSALPSAAATNDNVLASPIYSYPGLRGSLFLPHSLFPARANTPLSSDSLSMSSTEHTTISPSNLELIIDALGDYTLRMGIDFSQNTFVEELQRTNTPNDILNLLQQREEAFIQYRNRNRTLINCFSPAVRVLHIFSEKLGDMVNLVSFAIPFLFSFRCDRFDSTLVSPSLLQRLSLSELMFSSPWVYFKLFSTNPLVTHGYVRLPAKSVPIMMPSSTSSNAWATS